MINTCGYFKNIWAKEILHFHKRMSFSAKLSKLGRLKVTWKFKFGMKFCNKIIDLGINKRINSIGSSFSTIHMH